MKNITEDQIIDICKIMHRLCLIKNRKVNPNYDEHWINSFYTTPICCYCDKSIPLIYGDYNKSIYNHAIIHLKEHKLLGFL